MFQTISLPNAMKINGVKKFLFSSASIYGEPKYLPMMKIINSMRLILMEKQN